MQQAILGAWKAKGTNGTDSPPHSTHAFRCISLGAYRTSSQQLPTDASAEPSCPPSAARPGRHCSTNTTAPSPFSCTAASLVARHRSDAPPATIASPPPISYSPRGGMTVRGHGHQTRHNSSAGSSLPSASRVRGAGGGRFFESAISLPELKFDLQRSPYLLLVYHKGCVACFYLASPSIWESQDLKELYVKTLGEWLIFILTDYSSATVTDGK